MVLHLTHENFEQEIKNNSLILVDFWADWCGPCKAIAPVLEELATDFEGKVVIGKYNVDSDKEIPVRFGVRSIPTLVLIKDGTEIDRIIGSRPKEEFAEFLNKHL